MKSPVHCEKLAGNIENGKDAKRDWHIGANNRTKKLPGRVATDRIGVKSAT